MLMGVHLKGMHTHTNIITINYRQMLAQMRELKLALTRRLCSATTAVNRHHIENNNENLWELLHPFRWNLFN